MRLNEKEVWKPVYGYEGIYEISNLGRIKSIDRYRVRDGVFDRIQGKELRQIITKSGYVRVNLSKNGKSKMHLLHRLVLLSFGILPCGDKQIVNHKNFKRNDNRLENLEWVSYRDNYMHSIENITKNFGKRKYHPVIRISDKKIYVSAADAGHDNGISRFMVWAACKGKGSKSGEFEFVGGN